MSDECKDCGCWSCADCHCSLEHAERDRAKAAARRARRALEIVDHDPGDEDTER